MLSRFIGALWRHSTRCADFGAGVVCWVWGEFDRHEERLPRFLWGDTSSSRECGTNRVLLILCPTHVWKIDPRLISGFDLFGCWVSHRFLLKYTCVMRPTNRTRIIVSVWAVGFLVGTITHTIDLMAGGLNAYAGFPEPVRWFWVSLTLIDPLVLVLLFLRSRAVMPVAVLVMVADLAVNWSVFFTVGGLTVFGVVMQSLFGMFVFLTSTHVWVHHRR